GPPASARGPIRKKSMIISAGVDLPGPLRAGGGESQYKQDGLCWKGHA
ncbi:6-phosphofructokinase II, partial [Klebsiella pneumoniae]